MGGIADAEHVSIIPTHAGGETSVANRISSVCQWGGIEGDAKTGPIGSSEPFREGFLGFGEGPCFGREQIGAQSSFQNDRTEEGAGPSEEGLGPRFHEGGVKESLVVTAQVAAPKRAVT